MLLFLVFLLAYTLSQFYRSFLAVIAPGLAAELGLTASDLANVSAAWFAVFALAQFPLDQTVTVRLHPADVESCTALLQSNDGERVPEIRWVPDSHVHRGGCLIEGRERIIDGRVDTALERIYRVIGNVQAS